MIRTNPAFKMAFKTIFLLLPFFLYFVEGQTEVPVRLAVARLPSTRCCFATAYDGDDKVYIFGGLYYAEGGVNETVHTDILEYTISADSIQLVAHLPEPSANAFGNPAVFTNDGKVIMIPAHLDEARNYSSIIEFDPATRTVRELTTFWSAGYIGLTLLQDKPDSLLVIANGDDWYPYRQDILRFNLTSHALDLLHEYPSKELGYFGAVLTEENRTLIFAKEVEGPNAKAFYHDSETGIDEHFANIQFVLSVPKIAPAAGVVYLMSGPGLFSTTLGVFNLTTGETGVYTLGNTLPILHHDFGLAYEQMGNRLFIFGGAVVDEVSTFYDEIWYIDLADLQ